MSKKVVKKVKKKSVKKKQAFKSKPMRAVEPKVDVWAAKPVETKASNPSMLKKVKDAVSNVCSALCFWMR